MRDDPNEYLTYLKDGSAKIWSLLIGVDYYRDPRLSDLSCAVSDCQKLHEAIAQATQDFPGAHPNILCGNANQLLTKNDVEQQLTSILQSARLRDTLVIYFSGHGAVGDDDQLYLCLSETDTAHLSETGLSVHSLLQQLKTANAKRQVVVMDACHSGGTIEQFGAKSRDVASVIQRSPSDISVDELPEFNPAVGEKLSENLQDYANASGRNFCALLSCEKGQQSWETRDLGGVFTHYLVEGLKGKAANIDGVINTNSLFDYVYANTQLSAARIGKKQTPDRFVRRSNIILGIAYPTQNEEELFAPPPSSATPTMKMNQQRSKYLDAFSYCYQRQYPAQISDLDRQRLDAHASAWMLRPEQAKALEEEFIQAIQPSIQQYIKDLKRHVY